jgi:hypothetical protein
VQQMRVLMRHYERAMESYTYLTGDAVDPPGPVTGG